MPRDRRGIFLSTFISKNLVTHKKIINFAFGMPHHGILMQEWWNGRHGGLKIPWPLRLCGFESHFLYFECIVELSAMHSFSLSYPCHILLFTIPLPDLDSALILFNNTLSDLGSQSDYFCNNKKGAASATPAKNIGYEHHLLHFQHFRSSNLHITLHPPHCRRTSGFPNELRRPHICTRNYRRTASHAV